MSADVDIGLAAIVGLDEPAADRCAHIIRDDHPDRVAAAACRADEVVEAAIAQGVPLVALCGYRWVPTHRGEQLPLCRRCSDLWAGVVSDG